MDDVYAVGARYARAIAGGSYVDWIEMYIGVFAALSRSLHAGGTAKTEALERLLLLINDDLGSQIFDAQAREELSTYAYASAPVAALGAFRENVRMREQQAR